MDQENVSATLTVAVPAARVFAVLADPASHAAIDGTGWVVEAADQAPLTEVGQIFREYIHFPPFGPDHLGNSLLHLAELAQASTPGG